MAEFSMNEVVEVLQRRGVHAYVEQTGGGVATIFAGPRWDTVEGGHPNVRWAAVAGPGWFEGPGWTDARALVDDFYVGPDDDGDSLPIAPKTDQATAVADAVQTQIQMSAEARALPVEGRDHVNAEDGHLCVFELRELLDGLPGGARVVLDDGKGWYVHPEVKTPAYGPEGQLDPDGEGIMCVTFFPTEDSWDPRECF